MILITRPAHEAELTIKLLEEKGHKTLAEPLLAIRKLQRDLSRFKKEKVQNYVVTSQNARDFVPQGARVVGIPESGKNAIELMDYIMDNLSPDEGKIIYLRGDNITLDIAKILKESGYDAEEAIVYESVPVEEFSNGFAEKLKDVRTATFFSYATYKNFVRLCHEARISSKLSHINAVFISEKMAKYNADLWKNVYIADEPDMESMVRKTDEISKL